MRQTFFRNFRMLYVKKISRRGAWLRETPTFGMWLWAEWMDGPTDRFESEQTRGRGLMQRNMFRAAAAALLLAGAAAIGASGAIAAGAQQDISGTWWVTKYDP